MKDDHRFSDHGGDWYSFLEEYGCLPLDFSASVSPLGLPESARDAARSALSESARYPDPACRALRKEIAKEYRVPSEWILCGNGAADIIYRIAYAARPRRALLMAPCFAEYERALRRAGAEVDFYFPDALSKGRNTIGSEPEWWAQGPCEAEVKVRLETADVPETAGVPEVVSGLENPAVRDSDAMWSQGFRITDVSRFLGHIHPDTDMIMLGEPNNPTGLCTDRVVLTQIADFCEARGIRLVLDECFMDFAEDGEERSWLHRWRLLREKGDTWLQDDLQEEGENRVRDNLQEEEKEELRDNLQEEEKEELQDENSAEDMAGCREPIRYRNVCVVRAFTKFYGMAGLRLGWCAIPDREFRREVILAGPPWSVSCMAQAAGIAALGDHAYRTLLREMIGEERPRLVKGLQELGFFVLPGEANFLMFYVSEDLYSGKDRNASAFPPCREGGGAPSSLLSCYPPETGGPIYERTGPADICELLRPYGIMIRDLRSFYGLGPGWYRTAVRTEEENERLLEALLEIFGLIRDRDEENLPGEYQSGSE